jgi:hypothetical protein
MEPTDAAWLAEQRAALEHWRTQQLLADLADMQRLQRQLVQSAPPPRVAPARGLLDLPDGACAYFLLALVACACACACAHARNRRLHSQPFPRRIFR